MFGSTKSILPELLANLYSSSEQYEICPSDLRKVPIRPTKNAHPTYEKWPSDLRKMPIPPTQLVAVRAATINYFYPTAL